ncbi:MAG: FG-GAP-like repeat-containing protein [Chitinophagaceae bacterium]|nr:FG-GAP-like repeat-containing protein [Chitinophagaceae bacterium]
MKSNFFELVKMLCIIASISFSAQAQLTEFTGSSFIQLSYATSSWGDIDNDGDLDLFISGEDTVRRRLVNDTTRIRTVTAKLYRNDGGTSFSAIPSSVRGVMYGSSNFLDYDNDGNLDLFIVGRNDASWSEIPKGASKLYVAYLTNTSIASLYKGDGQGGFNEVFPGTFRGVQNGGTSAVGDYDNDGDVDIFVAGANQSQDLTALLYRNDGEMGFFVDTRPEFSSLKVVGLAAASFIDINKDGYLDLFYSGYTQEFGSKSYLYINNNGDGYSLAQDSLGAPEPALAFADYDKNGSIDRFLDGNITQVATGVELITNVLDSIDGFYGDSLYRTIYKKSFYRDRFSDRFRYNKNRFYNGVTKKDFSIPRVYGSPSAVFTDIDNDGNIELLIAGIDTSNQTPITHIYEYNNTTFSKISSNLAGVFGSDISIADVNKDGKVDVLLSGINNRGNNITKLYINTGTSTNTVPTKPIGLTFISDSLKLRWTPSTDEQGNNNITYSVEVDIAGSITGIPKITTRGDFQTHFAYINKLSSGEYSARVQAIDLNGAGSEWSDEVFFTIYKPYTFPAKDIKKKGNTIFYTATWKEEPNATSIIVQTSNSMDFANANNTTVTGLTSKKITFSNLGNSTSFYYRIQITTGNDTFTSNVQSFTLKTIAETSVDVFTGVVAPGSTFGDYDKDGDLDLLVTGGYGENKISAKLYKNEGDGEYTEVSDTNFEAVKNGSSNMIDIDNDGDLDIFITGDNDTTVGLFVNGSSRISQVYRNDSRGETTLFIPIFTDVFEGVGPSNSNFTDWDNDGDLDLFLFGFNANTESISRVYQNNRTGFELLNIPFKKIQSITNSSTITGDYDNDGDLDFLVTTDILRKDVSEVVNPVTLLYRNDGGTAFVEQTGSNFPFTTLIGTSADFGDYNNDGYLDLIVSGMLFKDSIINISRIRAQTILYTNNRGSSFIADTTTFQGLGIYDPVNIFGDFNNDGYSDLLLSGSKFDIDTAYGRISRTQSTRLYFNNRGSFSRTNVDSTTFAGVGTRASVNFGDIDNDDDLDIFVAGYNSLLGPIAKMYHNNGTVFNTKPGVVILNDVANITEASIPANGTIPVRFSWTPSVDANQTNGLSYNIYVGEKTNKNSIVSSNSDMSVTKSGMRSVVSRGSIQGTSYTLSLSLQKGKKYYWSVQAIDASFAGGEWAQEDSFEIGNISNKMNQIITFTTIPTQTFSGTNITIPLFATSTSGLLVSFSSANTFVSVSGNTLTIRGGGTAVITAYQEGNEIYNAATPTNQNVVVNGNLLNQLTSIEKNNSLIKIYPNPVKNGFYIEVDKTLVDKKYYQLMSMNGQKVINGYFTDSRIQIPTIKPGYYILLVFDNYGGLLQKEKIKIE